MILFVVFVFGLAIGSFLNAFIYRLEIQQGLRQIANNRRKTGVTVMRGRSFCPYCNHNLAWHDLIPLLSFILLRGRCRYCNQRISFQYPLIELVTALLFIAVASVFSPWFSPWFSQGVDNLAKSSFPQTLELLYFWAIAALLIAVFVYDLKHFLIPDKILYPAIGLAVLWRVFEFLSIGIPVPLFQAVLAGMGASFFFFTIYALSKGRAMGFGDVKLAFLLGLFLGWPSLLVALFFAFFIGAVVGLILIALKKKGLKSEVPFAPFLIMGTAISFFFGESILHWYLSLFLV